MKIAAIIIGTLSGTSLMTLFSYFLSKITNRNFREPDLLNELLSNFRKFGCLRKPVLPGWILHYIIGFIFVTGFYFIWEKTSVAQSLISGSLMGLICGFIGVAGWHLTLSLHPNPPSIHLKKYYIHLLIAHIIFGWCAAAGYKSVI